MLVDYTHFLTYWKKFAKRSCKKINMPNQEIKEFCNYLSNKRRGELRGNSDYESITSFWLLS